MTLYETLFVVHPEKGPRVKEFIEKFKKVIESKEGTMAQVDEWGARDLAYRIEKQGRGFYTLMRYHTNGAGVEELIEKLLSEDLASLAPRLKRHHILLGRNKLL